MSILERLGLAPKKELIATDVALVHRIQDALERLPVEHARFVGTFSMLLARVAHADLDTSEVEVAHMEQLLVEAAALTAEEAKIAVDLARAQQRLFGITEGYLAAREFRAASTHEDRMRLLDALFAVAAADGVVSVIEEETVRQIASELGLGHEEYVHARAKVRAHREVLKVPAPPTTK
jgi:uncharacterized tellurite resistance protein B-like protein